MTRINTLRQMSSIARQKFLNNLKLELIKFNYRKPELGKYTNRIKQLKKDIARIKTIENEILVL